MKSTIQTLLVFWSAMLLLCSSSLSAQNLYRKDCIYLICRGTKQKVGLIAEKYNLKDPHITHVGIGLWVRKKFMIYHVINDRNGPSDLVIESLAGFKSPQDLFYLSIWACAISKKEQLRLYEILQSYSKQKITFDTDFKAQNKKLYCSEFCVEVLEKLNNKKFHFVKNKQTLDFFSSKILEREVIEYYPVDFFQNNPNFKKIFEQNIN